MSIRNKPGRFCVLFIIAAAFILSIFTHAQAGTFTIAAASDLTYALSEVIESFRVANPDATINVTYGSSGKLCAQIMQGAPFDLFMSADSVFPNRLVAAGYALEPVIPYGLGRIVIWSAVYDATKMTLGDLRSPKMVHIAIADPAHAPYGLRAQQSLEKMGLWEVLKPRIVFGENIAQAAQFVFTGNADAGIIALSVALAPDLAKKGGYALIPDSLHEPLVQALVVTSYGREHHRRDVERFVRFMTTPPARTIMEKFGFLIPAPVSTAAK